ncbi:MAG TPA: CsbD family protein [Sphingomonas sp.]|jgi:uncharacterized protein YjbJ (UPF0337 family)|nr:CsbD family protein [Sphingomonas sp.]
MNSDTLQGDTKDFGGQVKDVVGTATGDDRLRSEGVADQIGGQVQKGYGVARDSVAPFADKARQFAKDRPFAAAALVGVIGVAVLNTLRGR